MTPLKIKQTLLAYCQNFAEERRQKVLKTITNIEESLFEEGKSTAGDKHHTGRAMLQIDRENAGKQLQEAEKLTALAAKIQVVRAGEVVSLGSLVHTETVQYFIGVSAGLISLSGTEYYCVSPSSPIGQLLLGKREGDSYIFRDESHQITAVL